MTTTPLSERKRSVDLNNFSDTEIEELSKKIGDLISDKVRNCVIECQKILQIYQMDIYLQYSLFPIGFPPPIAKAKAIDEEEVEVAPREEQVSEVTKKKRGRPKKVNA